MKGLPIQLQVALFLFLGNPIFPQDTIDLRNTKMEGYRGIWFELDQKYDHGDKYSGGLGTYTAKHIPLALYSKKADKTFFVYGGTTDSTSRHLLAMAGTYDHFTQTVSRPTVVFDKMGVDDPHDNPVLQMDDAGHLWVFVSGRGSQRKGIKLRSREPYSTERFDIVSKEEFTYPQLWKTSQGFFHFFTKYTGVRELYFETSNNGLEWSATQKLAGIPSGEEHKSGHYQVSSHYGNGSLLGTFFNRHINGHPDARTDVYYVETRDHGKTWQTVKGDTLTLPVQNVESPARVIDYHSQGKNVYLKDMAYTPKGYPILLYINSKGHEPGPENSPYQWCLTQWTGTEWKTSKICESDHNYDMGSVFLNGPRWMLVAPTETRPQKFGAGGELAIWISMDQGTHWKRKKIITESSKFNHSYVRRSLNAKAPFHFFWADGNPEHFSKSELFFGDFGGTIYKLPYTMANDHEKPLKIKH